MAIIIILITISLSIAIVFLAIFCWNMKSGQYDDTYTPSVRMLFDNRSPAENAAAPVRQKKQTQPGSCQMPADSPAVTDASGERHKSAQAPC